MGKVTVRYIVSNVDAAITFYTTLLDFQIVNTGQGFAALSRGDLQLLLNQPGAGNAGQAMPNGDLPSPGGWNRFQIEVDDLEATYQKLRVAGAHFRNEPMGSGGRRQVLLEDPSGNPVELFHAG